MVLGAGTEALAAKSKAATLKLGVHNAVRATTSMAGAQAEPVLRLDNDGAGPALDLRMEPGQAPVTANPEAGTATDLSADELDSKDSSEFTPSDGFDATEAINRLGPLPREGTFTSKGGTVLI